LTVLELPEEVYQLIAERARRLGTSVEELVIDAVASLLDPSMRVELYLRFQEKLLRDAEELNSKGDLVQASEKYWGAVSALLNAVGERENIPHYTYQDLKEIAIHLTEKEGDKEYTRLLSSAETLHANYYHNFLGKTSYDAHREDALRLIERLKRYLET
jgi:hypothetical protein